MTCTNNTASVSDVSFWNSVDILIQKPHVVNKRLWGSKTLFRETFKSTAPVKLELYVERIKNVKNIQEYTASLYENLKVSTDDPSLLYCVYVILLVELLPKTYNEKHAFQVVILNKNNITASFYDVTPNNVEQNLCPTFSYSFKLHDNSVQLEVDSG